MMILPICDFRLPIEQSERNHGTNLQSQIRNRKYEDKTGFHLVAT